MHRLHRLAALIVTVLCVQIAFAQQPATNPSIHDNAALSYWPAFMWLPRDENADAKVIGNWDTVPLNEETKKVAGQYKSAMAYLHKGAAMRDCDWGLDFSEGPALLLPYLNYSRGLANLAFLRARVRFDGNDQIGAVDDIMDTMALARHAGSSNILINLLVQIGTENAALKAIAPNLDSLDPVAMKHLSQRMAQLPPGATLKACIETEKQMGPLWLIAQIHQWEKDPDWSHRALGSLSMKPPELDAMVEACGKTPEGMIAQVQKLESGYDELESAVELPPEQAMPKLSEIAQRMHENPVGAFLFPAMDRAYQTYAQYRQRMDQFNSVITDALAKK